MCAMRIKKIEFHSAWIVLVGIVITMMTLAVSSNVSAQASYPFAENGTCASCHEDLYILHDTGKWFCIRESPMLFVDCHSDNPYPINQENTHTNRKTHPILNEHVSKSQECHLAECDERVAKFDRTTGISSVLLAILYQPAPRIRSEQPLEMPITEPVENPVWISAIEIIVLVLITSLALIIYFIRKTHHAQTNKRRNK
jgi:hypothetical protein